MLKERSAILSEDYISGRASMSRDEERRSRGVRLCSTLQRDRCSGNDMGKCDVIHKTGST